MQAFNFGSPNLFVKGIAEVSIRDNQTGNIIGYDRVASEGAITSSINMGEITGGIGNPLLITIPDTTRITGSLTSSAFSLRQRALISGGTLANNGQAPVVETEISPSAGGVLTIPNLATYPPVRPYGQNANDTYAWCSVKEHGATAYSGTNVGIDIATGVVQGTYDTNKKYDIFYTTTLAAAKVLDLPSNFTPSVAHLSYKFNVYAKQSDNSTKNGSITGYLYFIVPNAQFTGDVGISASQTANATTDYSWNALATDENLPATGDFRNCYNSASPYAYYVYVPCGASESDIAGLFVEGGLVSVVEGATKQIPVKYLMKDGTTAQPIYTALTYTPAQTSTATVSASGVVTGGTAGNTTVTIKLTSDETLQTICNVVVTAE
uniref:BIG2 domain-containing protein n=1 Tax=Siphoviridae sp. ctnMR5 TaxID=2825658 RepID=A0A8S5U8V3_9CAUD|nr:MAG TPA: hypothetical protein [Siphoviridae sp. ctnMR5]